jgi:hypothetical protein
MTKESIITDGEQRLIYNTTGMGKLKTKIIGLMKTGKMRMSINKDENKHLRTKRRNYY